LVAISKGQSIDRVSQAIVAGQRVFGENRVQEAGAKYAGIKGQFADLELHLVGRLQTNKVAQAVALFDVIETLDRFKLATMLAREMQRTGRRPSCYVQVNTGEEAQKTGVMPNEADSFIHQARDGLGLPIAGLMCIPPVDEAPAPHFALLKKIADRNALPSISMGMSGDFATAIEFGATHVRVGTAIFGARN
jgi:pyridoxal phosphate enzyme (YggS family)